jgi:hypothetical protein
MKISSAVFELGNIDIYGSMVGGLNPAERRISPRSLLTAQVVGHVWVTFCIIDRDNHGPR